MENFGACSVGFGRVFGLGQTFKAIKNRIPVRLGLFNPKYRHEDKRVSPYDR